MNLLLIGWASFSFLPHLSLATSEVRGAPQPVSALRKVNDCAVTAKFIEAKPNRGKVTWTFERTDSKVLSAACRDLGRSFEIWIWSGSFSTLSNSLVYPLSVMEPKAGQEFDLLLDYTEIRERASNASSKSLHVKGWFLSPDADSMKALTK